MISHNVISNTGDVRSVGTGNGVPDSPESDTVVRLLKALWSDQVTRAQEGCDVRAQPTRRVRALCVAGNELRSRQVVAGPQLPSSSTIRLVDLEGHNKNHVIYAFVQDSIKLEESKSPTATPRIR